MNKIKKEYLSPELTVVEFAVERGYAASVNDPGLKGAAQQIQMMAESMIVDERADGDPSSGNRLVGGYLEDGGSSSSSAYRWGDNPFSGGNSWF